MLEFRWGSRFSILHVEVCEIQNVGIWHQFRSNHDRMYSEDGRMNRGA